MATPTFRGLTDDDRFKALDPEQQAAASDRYWDSYAAENPDAPEPYVTAQRDQAKTYIGLNAAARDAAPVEKRALELQAGDTAFNFRLGEAVSRGEIPREDVNKLAAEHVVRTKDARDAVTKLRSLSDPEVATKMQPAFEALGSYAVRGGQFGSPSLDARVSDILPGGEKDAVKTSREAYTKLRDSVAADFKLSPDELDDVVKHRLDLQTEPVSRDALGTPYVKNEVLAQGTEATAAAINNSTLPWSMKQRMVDGLSERIAGFKKQVVTNIAENSPELADHLGFNNRAPGAPAEGEEVIRGAEDSHWLTDDEKFARLSEALRDTTTGQAAGGAAAGLLGTLDLLPEGSGRNLTGPAKAITEQLNAASAQLNTSKTKMWGTDTDAAAFGQGAYSVAESIGIGALTGGLGAPIAAERIAGLGKWGKALAGGLNAGAKIAPVAGFSAAKQGVQTYDQALAAGKTPEEATKLAFTSAAIEFGVTALFSAAHMGGVEDVGAQLTSKASKEALAGGFKQFVGKTALGITGEELEETLISTLDAVAVQAKLNPNMTVEDLQKTIKDTALVTLAVSGPASALGSWAEMRNKPTYDQSTDELEVRANATLAETVVPGAADPLAAGSAAEVAAAALQGGDPAVDGAPSGEPTGGDNAVRDDGAKPLTDKDLSNAGILPPDPTLPEAEKAAYREQKMAELAARSETTSATDGGGEPLPDSSEARDRPAEGLDPEVSSSVPAAATGPLTPEAAEKSLAETGSVPEGWMIHGRAGKQDLETGNVIQLTDDPEVADQYAGKKGSKWLVRPKDASVVADMRDPELRSGAATKLMADFEAGDLSPSLDAEVQAALDSAGGDRERALEILADEFNPPNIVESAEAWDSRDRSGWFFDSFGKGYVLTDDGAVVLDRDSVETRRIAAPPEVVEPETSKPEVSNPTNEERPPTATDESAPPVDEASALAAKPVTETAKTENPQKPITPAPPVDDESTTGMQNAKVDAARVKRGLPERFAPARIANGAAWDAALKQVDQNPDAGRNLVESVRSSPRPLDPVETALFTHRQLSLEQVVDDKLEAVNKNPGDATALGEMQTALANLQETYDVGQAVGTKSGQSLQARKILVNQDYSLARMLAREQAEVNQGKPLTAKQTKEVSELHEKIAGLEKRNTELTERVAAHEAEQTFKNQAREFQKEASASKARGEQPQSFLDAQAEAARQRIAERKAQGRLQANLDPSDLLDHAIIGVSYLAKGIKTAAAFTKQLVKEFGEGIRKAAPQIFKKSKELARTKAPKPSSVKTVEEARSAIEPGDPVTGKVVYDLAKAYLNSGLDGFENVMNAVLADLQKTHPGLTLREVHDAYSGYGKVQFPSKAEDKVKLAEYKSLARLSSQLEDAERGLAPLKTGPQRDAATVRVHNLQKQVSETMRRLNIKPRSNSSNLRSGLDAMKSRLRNTIEELEVAIRDKTPRVTTRTPIDPDAEAAALKERRDALQKDYDAIFEKKGLSDADRAKLAVRSLNRLIGEEESLLAKGLTARPATGLRSSAWTPEIADLKAKLDGLRENRAVLRKSLRPRRDPAEVALERATKALERSVERQREIVRTGTLPSKADKPPAFTPNAEIKALLREQGLLNELVKELRAAVPPTAQQEAKARAALIQRLAERSKELDRKIRTGDLSTKPRKDSSGYDPVASKIKQTISQQQEVLARMKRAAAPLYLKTEDWVRLRRQKASLNSRIERLRKRLAAGDYAPRARPDPVNDTEKARLQLAEINLKRQFNQRVLDAKLAERTLWKKSYHFLRDLLGVPRALNSSIDFGGVLRQGNVLTIGSPSRLARNFTANFKSMSKAGAQKIQNQLEANPFYATAVRGKLHFAEWNDSHDFRKMEENYNSRLAKKIGGIGTVVRLIEKLPGIGDAIKAAEKRPVAGKLIRGAKLLDVGQGVEASERTYASYLNSVRMDAFAEMARTISTDGKTIPDEAAKVIANFVNIASGRGNLGKFETAAEALSLLMFSPKYLVSRFQYLTGLVISAGDTITGFQLRPKETRAAHKAIAWEYAKFLRGAAIIYGVVQAAAALWYDDDDPEKPRVELDPRSADFGKIRIGKNRRIDLMSGLSQTATFTARTVTGKSKTADGKIRPLLGDKVIPDQGLGDVWTRFFRSKLAPVPSTLANLKLGRDVVNEKVFPESEALGSIAPLSVGDIYSALKEQGVAEGTAQSILVIFGAGVQSYGDGAPEPWEQAFFKRLGVDPARYADKPKKKAKSAIKGIPKAIR